MKEKIKDGLRHDLILLEIGGFRDVASYFRDVWMDINDILDYEDEREKKLLDSFLGIIINFEKEIDKSMGVVDKLLKEEE